MKHVRGAAVSFKVFRSDHMPADSPNRWYVYDYTAGMLARQDDGRLAYFRTRREAAAFVEARKEDS